MHYKGWKQTWDEWVAQDRVLQWNEENLQKQKDLKSAHTQRKKPAKQESSTSSAPRGTKRGRDTSVDKEEAFMSRLEVRIPIPEPLKAQLVDDWENVTKNQQLVSLPRNPTVAELLKQYKKSVEGGKNRRQDDVLSEVLAGIKTYFDKSLGNNLLYRFERHQYVEIRKKYADKEMSEVYGAEHLLRLFVSMPALLAHTNMDQEAVNVLREHISDFLKYLVKRQKEVLLTEYENASPHYQGLARV